MSARARTRTVVIAVLVLGLALFAVVVAPPLYRHLSRHALQETGPSGLGLERPGPDDRWRIDRAEPALAIDVYRPQAPSPSAAILLLHGNRSAGGTYPLYRLLARALADRGALVAVPSLRGYGDSGRVPAGRPLTAGDLLSDVRRCAARLEEETAPVPSAIVGHSIGSLLTLQVEPPDTWRRIAIEPGHDLRRRVVDPPAEDLDRFTMKLNFNIRGPSQGPETVRALYRELDPEGSGRAAAPGTLLVIQGRRVSPERLASTDRVVSARPNTDLLLLDSADHEFGATGIAGFVVYPRDLIAGLADAILEFTIDGRTTGPGPGGGEG